jgi:thioredoxin 1
MKKILKFEAEWCGQCKALAPILRKVLENHTDITLTTVDIETEEETTLKYNIRNLPTLVFIKDDIEVGRTSGVLTANVLEDKIKEFYA